jgi:hypothetical protein
VERGAPGGENVRMVEKGWFLRDLFIFLTGIRNSFSGYQYVPTYFVGTWISILYELSCSALMIKK